MGNRLVGLVPISPFLEFVKDASDPLYSELKPLVEENLRFFLSSRDKWGIWGITWGWADYPSSLPLPAGIGRALGAVERYKTLRAFGQYRGAGLRQHGKEAGVQNSSLLGISQLLLENGEEDKQASC